MAAWSGTIRRGLSGRGPVVAAAWVVLVGCLASGEAGAQSGFLAEGGAISLDRPAFSGGDDAFLEDGGSISSGRIEVRKRRGRGFLEDGGSITSGRDRLYPRGYFVQRRPGIVLRHRGSITTVYDAAPRLGDDRPAIVDYGTNTSPSDGVAIRGDDFDTRRSGGGYRRGRDAVAASGPKIIDVASARLDRRPIGPSGIDVIHAGNAKIIRISPDYDRRVAAVDDARSASHLEPWSGEWLRYCVKTYPSFDPDRGTYSTGDGRSRFCTGR